MATDTNLGGGGVSEVHPLHFKNMPCEKDGLTEPSTQPGGTVQGLPWLLALVAFVVLVVSLCRPGRHFPLMSAARVASSAGPSVATNTAHNRDAGGGRVARATEAGWDSRPEGVVARKVNQFVRQRRELIRSVARRLGLDVPDDIERFFDAMEAGQWEEIDRQWKRLAQRSGQYEGSENDPTLNPYWPAVLDAFGVVEQAHLWPADKLLDYGNAILRSLRPGMVYVGGTDAGRWIPELLNETGPGEPHIILTQNALADHRYLEFVTTLYGDRMQTLSTEDSERIIQEYKANARSRLEHDQQHPDEPKQLLPKEAVLIVDGEVSVSGQGAVMSINERLLQALLDRNPGLSFAIEHSFPFKSTYAESLPTGPILEIRATDGAQGLTPERAASTVDYWRTTSEQVLTDSSSAESKVARLAFSKLAANQADVFLSRGLSVEAEATYRYAHAMAPESAESVLGLTSLLIAQGRFSDALPVAEQAVQANPENQDLRDLLKRLRSGR